MKYLYELLKKCKFLQLSISILLIVMSNLAFGQPLATPNNGNNGNGVTLTAVRGISVEPVRTYEFYIDENSTEPYYTQCVKNGDILNEPTIPIQEGKIFEGWFIGDNIVDFGNQTPIDVTQTETVKVYAHFSEKFYVDFIYQDKVISTNVVEPNSLLLMQRMFI